VAKPKWEPAVFHEACEKLPVRDQRRLWDDLKQQHKKLLFEWKTFWAFARVSGLDIDPGSIEMCDPNAASPPFPDVRCRVSGQLEYFELGEVTAEDLARKASIAMKNRSGVYGGATSQRQPLARICLKKCRKRYTTNGRPLHLIMHFAVGRQVPNELSLPDDLSSLMEPLRQSPFTSVWLYDGWEKQVLLRLDRSGGFHCVTVGHPATGRSGPGGAEPVLPYSPHK
jgi:hypothetical protein